MNHKKGIGIALALTIVLAASYYYFYHYRHNEEQLQASGTIEATSVEIRARLNGTIAKIAVTEGSAVTEGQLLAELSRPDLVAQRERDALGVLVAQTHYHDLAAGARAEEITQAASVLNLATANLEQAQVNLERAEQLFQAGALSREKYEAARLALTAREEETEAAQAKLTLVEAGNRPGVISAAAAEWERSKAVLKAADAMLEDLTLLAPLNGTVSSKHYEAGEYVPLGASLLSISDLEHLWLKVYIPADDLPRVNLNQPVDVQVSGSSTIFKGTVASIAVQGEFTPKTIQTKNERANVVYAVKITVNNQNGELKPGMPADVVFSGS